MKEEVNVVYSPDNQRVRDILRVLKNSGKVLNDSDFATKTGVNRSYVSELRNDKRVLTTNYVEQICNSFPELSRVWLLTGEGPMMVEDNKMSAMTAKEVLEEVLSYTEMSVNSLASEIGLTRAQALYDIQNEKTKSITKSMADRINQKFPELSRVWLLTGEGPMMVGDNQMSRERCIDRFDKYMIYSGLNDNQVTKDAELSVGTIGKSRQDNRDLSNKVLNKLLYVYPELSRVWLLTGEGPMIVGDNQMGRAERLNEAYNYLRFKGIISTQKDVAIAMNSTQPNISSALRGEEKVLTDNFLQRFSNAYEDISSYWLLTGEGSMIVGNNQGSAGVNVTGTGNHVSHNHVGGTDRTLPSGYYDALKESQRQTTQLIQSLQTAQELQTNTQAQLDKLLARLADSQAQIARLIQLLSDKTDK